MRVTPGSRRGLLALLALGLWGCAGKAALRPPESDLESSAQESGPNDSIGESPGSPGALYRYRFRQIQPHSDRFTFQDRELSFYFRPAPDALHFQVENRQNRPVWIEWERSVFYDPDGGTDKVAHSRTAWADRFRSQGSTEIGALQRLADYVLPLSYLLDPVGREQQLHRPLLPEDTAAPQHADRVFGVDLVFLVENRPRVYSFRFRVASVIPP